MIFEEAQRRIVERMSPKERAEYDKGCQIVDFYMGIATNPALPETTRSEAREKLRLFAIRGPGQTVADIDGKPNN